MFHMCFLQVKGMNIIIVALILINVQICVMQVYEPLLNNIDVSKYSIFEISPEDMDLVFEGNRSAINGRLDYLSKTDSEKHDKLMKFINYNEIRLELLNRYTLAKNCAQKIREREFPEAADLLKTISISNYDAVIDNAYQNDTDNFVNILEFANFVYNENDNGTLILYQELLEQSEKIESESNLLKMAMFIDELYESSDWGDLKTRVLDKLFLWVSNIRMKPSRYYGSSSILEFIYKIYYMDNLMGSKLIKLLVEREYNETDYYYDFLNGIYNVPLKLHAFTVLYNLLINRREQFSLLEFSHHLNKFFQNNLEIDQDLKRDFIELAEKLPIDIKESNSSVLCIQNDRSKNYLKVPNNGMDPVYLSQGDTVYKRTRWIMQKKSLFYFHLRNVYLNRNINIRNLINTTDIHDILCQRTGDDYIRVIEPDGYLRDEEGLLTIGPLQDDFARWSIRNC